MRIYTAGFEAVAVTAVQDLISIVAPSARDVALLMFELWQTTDLGDAQEEVLRLRLRSGQTTAGSAGTTGTAVPLDVDDAASGSTIRCNDTTQASAGTIVVNETFGWNIRMPLQRIWLPENRPIIKGGRRATLELTAAPADSITMSGMLTWVEGIL